MTSKSENSTPMPPPPPPDAKATPKSRMKLIIASALIIIVVTAAFLGYWLFLRSGGGGGGGTNSWIFKGAYANFNGQGTYTGLDYTITMTIHEEVLNFNSTHAKILTSTTTDMGFGLGPFTSNSTSWVDLTKNDYNVENGTLISTYDATVTLSSLGTRKCIAYEYSISGGTMTVYVDKTVTFPVKFSMTITGTYSYNLDMVLVSTNILGL
jgi:hypothetical protein